MKMRSMGKTVVWGDSVARGVIYDERRARYMISKQAAARSVSAAIGTEVILRAHMGMTAVQGAALMEKDLEKGMVAEAALLGFGGNDSDFDWRAISENPRAEHKPRTPLPLYESVMRGMVRRLKQEKIRVFLTTLTPVIAERYFDFCSRMDLNREHILAWLGTKERIARFHAEYSRAVERIAAEEECPLIDLYGTFRRQKNMGDYFCVDGAHPNDAGQALIAGAVIEALATA